MGPPLLAMSTLSLDSPGSPGYQTLSPQTRRRFALGVAMLHGAALLAIGLLHPSSPVAQPVRELGVVFVSMAPAEPAPPLPPAPVPKLPVPELHVPVVPLPDPVPQAPERPVMLAAALSAPAPAPAVAASPAPAAAPAPTATVRPPPAPPPTGPRTIAISAVEYLSPPQLQYPLASRRLREQGQVQVRLLVDEQGRPQQATVVRSSGIERLDEAALSAARATRFKPYAEDGSPRPFWVVMPLVFELEA